MSIPPDRLARQKLARMLREDIRLDAVRPIEALLEPSGPGVRARFNSPDRRPGAHEHVATLVWDGTRLRWEYGRELAPPSATTGPAQRAFWWNRPTPKPAPINGEVVQQLVFEELDKAQIGVALDKLDRRLTPNAFVGAPHARGLRRWQDGGATPFDPQAHPDPVSKILVFIHGTFSESTSLLEEGLLQIPAGETKPKTKPGQKLLEDAEESYDLVLTFDHPTLSVSPALNAMDLAHALRPLKASRIDLVCHSRGGLVARWFCEVFCPSDVQRRVVLVASPIAGTSLASAPRVRDFFDFLTNVGHRLASGAELASLAAPWLAAGVGLMRLGTAITGGLSNLPIADGLIALVPGLQAQARVGNNEEILRLQRGVSAWHAPTSQLRYFAITADFQPTDAGWNFLKYFREAPARIANAAADHLFPHANDLVVDTISMTALSDTVPVPVTDCHDFGRQGDIHHCNYFRQPQTADKIRAWLEVPSSR